jgi:hypothetical protein
MALYGLEKYSNMDENGQQFKEIIIQHSDGFFIEIMIQHSDGFSSSLIKRRAIRDYVLDSNGSGFAAYGFPTRSLVNFNAVEVVW